MTTHAASILAHCRPFRDLAAADLGALAAFARFERVRAGQMLFFANQPADALRIVVRGAVKIYLVSPQSGREVVLTVERPFDPVAELPTFDAGAYPANGQAMEDGELLVLQQADFERVLHERPTIALHVMRGMGRRLRHLVGLVQRLSFQQVGHRLARDLLAQAEEGVPFELDTNARIAARIGTVPELVSRNLARLHDAEVVQLDGRRIERLDQGELVQMAAAFDR